MNELIHTRNTWLHFIGRYYDTPDRFIHEAKRSGISRRAPAQTVRGMQFGDRLVFIRYNNARNVMAFAEGKITGVTLQGEIAKEITEQLMAEGKAKYHGGGGGGTPVHRECGSYIVIGYWSVTCPLSEIVEKAIEKANERGEKLFVMVNASLEESYEPVMLIPSPKFTRGFIKDRSNASYHVTDDYQEHGDVVAVMNYAKAKHKPKQSRALALPIPTAG